VFGDGRSCLSLGLVLTIVVVPFEGLAVATIMPITALARRELALYACSFSGFMLGSLGGTVAVGEYAERRGPAAPLKGALAVFSCGLLGCRAARTMSVFIAGRVIEGLGTGAVGSVVWLTLNRAYPRRPRRTWKPCSRAPRFCLRSWGLDWRALSRGCGAGAWCTSGCCRWSHARYG